MFYIHYSYLNAQLKSLKIHCTYIYSYAYVIYTALQCNIAILFINNVLVLCIEKIDIFHNYLVCLVLVCIVIVGILLLIHSKYVKNYT